jgi:hypothetical protein
MNMTEIRFDINDEMLRELYKTFQEQRRTVGPIYSNVAYSDFVDNQRYSLDIIPTTLLASEHIITVTNTVNRFCYDLHSLIYWSKVFESASEDEKLMALLEFVTPISTQCLSAPYLTKQTIVKSICKISHQTNRLCTECWTEQSLKPDQRLNFDEAKKLAQHFNAWRETHDALSTLNDHEFVVASDDYRNKFQHGFPRRIEYGHSMVVERASGGSTYTIIDAPPLYIANLVSILVKQYKAAVMCHEAYINLMREQHKIWTSLLPS